MSGELVSKRSRLRAVAPKGFQGEHELDPSGIGESALEKGISVCNAKLSFLNGLPPESIDENALYKISNALSGLIRASIEARRFEMERAGAIRLAHDLLVGEVKNQLRSNPETVQAVLTEVATAKEKLEQ